MGRALPANVSVSREQLQKLSADVSFISALSRFNKQAADFVTEYKMIGSFITRGLMMIFGYAYPAYECFKTVEKNKPEIEQLRFWCQYWILVAVLTVCERISDNFISWIPMYSEAKLAFYIYLWYPKTKGTTYVYDSFFKPYIAKHETEIDRNLLELRTRAGDIVVLYWQKAASYGQTRIFEILQYVAAQSTQRPRPTQAPRTHRPAAASNRETSTRPRPQEEEPPSPSSTSSMEVVEQELSSPLSPSTEAPVDASNVLKKKAIQPAPGSASSSPLKKTTAAAESSSNAALKKTYSLPESSSQSSAKEAEDMQVESVSASTEDPPPPETVIEEAIFVRRGRPRKTRPTAK
ncbi:hypothetical protein Nepgr_025635 [Nepenthes gracilis]|uniref:HVA22-like protein n=1 Tax=Nepenthes gracilis TaxID=150966 RepID=A0AAD3T867_NEPGR|nr:hypothetical protein Nepgr_025635 [Nepenthes gracilis]